ncbi:MAG TPA: aminotransferase class V-fold PLP-dependent enzyme [Ktedonobacterales bacterium]|nr:aminotransferase class V-fold PLP-dependent enzyme [Ktedonobacterales bacterium]
MQGENNTAEASAASTAPIAEAGYEYLLREGITFLNHGSYGACPRPVFEVYQRWQRELAAQPVEFLGRRLHDLLGSAREALAAYVGTAADNLVFVPNATHGMNIVARSLRLEPGDEVLGTTHEYGAVERTWRFICGQAGAEYRSQPITLPVDNPETLIEQLWQGVTERTRVLVVSHITSPTALIFPIAAICRRAAAQGILTVIDGAHAPGQIDLALDTLGADFYTGNCHKWLCAPNGAGFLYARPERQALLQPLVVSWGWQARTPGPSPFQDFFGWTGTADPSAYLSVPAAIAFQTQHNWPQVRAACHALAGQARERIATLTSLEQICPDSPDWWAQMCTLPLPISHSAAGDALKQRLWDEYQIEVPIVDWQDKWFVRVSIQAYDAPSDVDRLVDALSRLL